MLKKERLYRIEGLLKQKPFITIPELQEELGVSRSSVMRDLDELEQAGRISRERGGASGQNAEALARSIYSEPSVLSRENTNAEEKKAIARAAAENLKDGSCIFLDSGTTPAYLIPYLLDKRIQIVTPSTYISAQIPSSFGGEVYLLGGSYLQEYDTVCGSLAIDMLDQFNFDQAFIGANGISLQQSEVSVFSEPIGALKKHAMKRSAKNILLVDSTKFSIKAMSVFAKLPQFDQVITNALPKGCRKPANVTICAKSTER